MFSDLELLAGERSSEKRRELLNAVTDMFLDGAERHNSRELALFSQIMMDVLDDVTIEAQTEFSNRVSDSGSTPHDLVLRLAGDVIEVSAPILQHSPVLVDADLVMLAQNQSQGHLLAISLRQALNEPVTDVLIERGDRDVTHAVSDNHGARLSTKGLRTLAEKSVSDPVLMKKIANREDLAKQIAETVLPLLSTEQSQKLRTLMAPENQESLSAVVSATQQDFTAKKASARSGRLEILSLVQKIRDGEKRLDSVLLTLARQNRLMDIGMLMTKISGLPETAINNALFKTNNEPIILLCKAINISAAAFRSVVDLRNQHLRLPDSHTRHALCEYEKLNTDDARRSLNFVKLRTKVSA